MNKVHVDKKVLARYEVVSKYMDNQTDEGWEQFLEDLKGLHRDYHVNCQYLSERTADYASRDFVTAQWQPLLPEESRDFESNGNLCASIKDGVVTIENMSSWTPPDKKMLYEYIPSALLMYRLACTFPGQMNIYGDTCYKFVWDFSVKHKKTNGILRFSEWKGSSGIWTRFHSLKDAPKEFIADAAELISYLVDKNCAHPYDGLVAGSVA